MKTTSEAIKYCLGEGVYVAAKKSNSNPELLKMACLRAFRDDWDNWPVDTDKYETAQVLRIALLILEKTGLFEEIP